MTKIGIIGSAAIVSLGVALVLALHLGLFAPRLAQVKGTPIRETPLVDLSGHKHSFQELRGQPVSLYFRATWCSPCLKHLAELGKAKGARDPLPIALEDDPRVVAPTLQRVGYHGPVWVATDGMSLLQRRYAGNDKRAVPFEVRLDAKGRILGAKYGG